MLGLNDNEKMSDSPAKMTNLMASFIDSSINKYANTKLSNNNSNTNTFTSKTSKKLKL